MNALVFEELEDVAAFKPAGKAWEHPQIALR